MALFNHGVGSLRFTAVCCGAVGPKDSLYMNHAQEMMPTATN